MRIKRYVSRTIQEALDSVREDLGPDAVILHTRKARRGGLAGLFGRERFEVIAALDVNVPGAGARAAATASAEERRRRAGAAGAEQGAARSARSRPGSGDVAPGRAGRAQRARPGAGRPEAYPGDRLGDHPGDHRGDASRNRGIDADTAGEALGATAQARWIDPVGRPIVAGGYGSASAAKLVEIHERLLDADVDPDLAEALIGAAKMKWREAQVAGKSANELVLDLITGMIPVAGGVSLSQGRRRVVALVGPTGVGKTTTLAKIAALLTLFGKKKVAFVTADTYRIAAVEQLRTYAEIIGVPCEVVYTPADMRQAMSLHEDRDLVLIDTAGRSPRSGMCMAELKAFLDAAQVDEAHLVLSMTTRPRDLLETVERFAPCGTNRIILSKLDETTRLGGILTLASSAGIPISYVTYGQNVPEDIEVAAAPIIAKWVLDGNIGDDSTGGESPGWSDSDDHRSAGRSSRLANTGVN